MKGLNHSSETPISNCTCNDTPFSDNKMSSVAFTIAYAFVTSFHYVSNKLVNRNIYTNVV